MSSSIYLSSAPKRRESNGRRFIPFVSLLLALVVGIVSLGIGIFIKPQEAEAGPVEWVVCEWAGEGSLPYLAYEAAFTDNLAFMFMSKSAISSGTEDVSSGLNSLLGVTHDFTATNEAILGTGLKTTSDFEGPLNGGVKVNPYDRFGVAGLYWSSYSGEWNYLKVNPCANGGTPVDMKVGKYYEGRLAPLSTWGGIAQSTDIRSVAAAQKATVLSYDWVNIVANGIFNITKFVVVVTNALIGLAFSDILSAVGITDMIASDDGIFAKLYSGIYLPLILFIMLIMAVWAFWFGIVKRAYRRTLGGIAQSVLLFIIAGIVAFQPVFFITLPNNIAIVAQSIIVNTLSTSLYAGDGLCTVGGVYVINAKGEQVPAATDSSGRVNMGNIGSTAIDDPENSRSLLQEATQSMQSVIGCQLWYTYLFNPWVQGQFGTEFNNLWAKGHSDSAGYSATKELPNENESWVGDAAVPLGGGYLLNNWALFHLSTQTNAHAVLGQEEPGLSVYTDGVANDWWRIVDAVSNYNETKQENGIPSGNECQTGTPIEGTGHCNTYNPSDTAPVESTIPDPEKLPTDYWQNWIGAKPGDRMAAALGSVLPAILGNLAPLIFAGMSVIFSLSIAIAMTFAPIFLLLGSWPGTGWNAFKSWGQLVLNITMKRIIAGVLLVLSIILIALILSLTSGSGFIGVLVLVIVSISLVKMRQTIFDRLAGIFSFNFASSAFSDTTGDGLRKMTKKSVDAAKGTSRMVTSGIQGANAYGKAGKDKGFGKFVNGKWVAGGAGVGVGQELRNLLYRSPTLNRAWMDAEAAKKNDPTEESQIISDSEICAYCSKKLRKNDEIAFNGGQDQDGNFVCYDCMSNPTATIGGLNPNDFGARWVERSFVDETKSTDDKTKHQRSSRGSSSAPAQAVETGMTEEKFEILKNSFVDPATGKTSDNLGDLMASLFTQEALRAKAANVIPSIPEELKPYVTPQAVDMLPHMWVDPNPQAQETIALVYANALVRYAYDEGGVLVGDISGNPGGGVKSDVDSLLGSMALQSIDGSPAVAFPETTPEPSARRYKDSKVFAKLSPAMRYQVENASAANKEAVLRKAWADAERGAYEDWDANAKSSGWDGSSIVPLTPANLHTRGDDWSMAENASMAEWLENAPLTSQQKEILIELVERKQIESTKARQLFKGTSVDTEGQSTREWLMRNYPVGSELSMTPADQPLVSFITQREEAERISTGDSSKTTVPVIFELTTNKGITIDETEKETVLLSEKFEVTGYEEKDGVITVKIEG